MSSVNPTTHLSAPGPVVYNMDTDIALLEAPTFTTLDRGPSQSMLSLKWDHNLNLIGKKVVNPMIHCCDKCLKPILIYGRMIPCKHVFCYSCASENSSACVRCKDEVVVVEQAGLGSIYMCTHGGSRYGNDGLCRRTYLSQRDLQAHFQHRHMKSQQELAVQPSSEITKTLPSAAEIAEATAAIVSARSKQPQPQQPSKSYDEFSSKRPHYGTSTCAPRGTSANVLNQNQNGASGAQIPVLPSGSATRQSNLITVPIQDAGPGRGSSPKGSQPLTSAFYAQNQASRSTYGMYNQHFYPNTSTPIPYGHHHQQHFEGATGHFSATNTSNTSGQWRTEHPSSYHHRR